MRRIGFLRRCRCCQRWSAARGRTQGGVASELGSPGQALMPGSLVVVLQSSVRMKLICRQIINQLLGIGINVSAAVQKGAYKVGS